MLLKQIKDNTDILVDEIYANLFEKDSRKRRSIIRRARPYEIKFKKVLQKLFKAQEKEVLANMRAHPRAVMNAVCNRELVEYSKGHICGRITELRIKQNWLSDWLFAEMMWRKRFETGGKPFIGGVMEDVGQAELDNLVVGIDFNISDPRVQTFLGDKLEKYSKDVNDTTLESLRKTLRTGVGKGESIPELQKRVQKVFSIADKTRATRIARTEVMSSANKASLEAYRQSGVVEKKEWLSAGDGDVRPSHRISGQKVDLDKKFTLGSGVQTDGPGQSGVAAEDILCRCTTVAIVKE